MARNRSPAASGTASDGDHASADRATKKTGAVWGIVVPVLISGLVFAVGAFSVAGVAIVLDEFMEPEDRAEILILPILLIYGVVTLVVAISVLASILSAFEPNRATAALGLPEGSVPAVIALILVLIFAITSVFLATIPQGDAAGDIISEEFATQILTTTGTLAVAVAGFYFGTRAVETGAATVTGQAVAKTLRITEPPSSPVTLGAKEGDTLSIRVAPSDASIQARMTGDDTGEIVQMRPGEFEYRRGKTPATEVTIHFELLSDPSAFADLIVRLPAQSPDEPSEAGALPDDV